MIDIVNADQMRAADAHAINDLGIPSLTLMETAATQVTSVILERYPGIRKPIVICGKGNNGGDGLVVARLLKQKGFDPVIVLLGKGSELKGDPAENFNRAISAQVPVVETTSGSALRKCFSDCDLVIDAILGTGLTRAAEGAFAVAIEAMNASEKHVIAIDVPSGLCSDSGTISGSCVRARVTVALAALKHCHVFAPASGLCGEVYLRDIGIPVSSSVHMMDSRSVAAILPARPADSHKGTFGHCLVIAGSRGKAGAAYLCGKAALRAGAGLATIASPAHAQQTIAAYGPELMTEIVSGNADYFTAEAAADLLRLSEAKTVAIGPGIGTDKQTLALFQQIVPEIQGVLVIDADGLNLLSVDKSILLQRKPGHTILTPHPGEMARLLGRETNEVQSDRIGAALKLADETKSIVVLKGYRTVIADPLGSVLINPTGGQALASGGTGDILTGIIAGFLAQHLQPQNAACAGTFVHGFTANLFESKYPQQALNALDILSTYNEAVHLIRTQKDFDAIHLGFHY